MAMEKKTKIVATIGPATAELEQMNALVDAGVNVFRINMSHGSHNDIRKYIENIKKVRGQRREYLGILADLQGPKIRVGKVEKALSPGENIILSCMEISPPDSIPVQYTQLYRDVKSGTSLLLDDGNLELEVLDVKGQLIHCKVVTGGELKSHKGINLPNASITTPVITKKDIEDLRFILPHEVDFVALSFVKNAENIKELKEVIKGISDTPVDIIAKIERHEAVSNLTEILQVTDAVMVARGDLGIEVPSEQVPILQKRIIKESLSLGKPVIVATQMLDSMIKNPRATRAETSDVANAVLDGADAIMLSGETSIGSYPLESVQVMKTITQNVEFWVKDSPEIDIAKTIKRELNAAEAVAQSATILAKELNAPYIVAATASGNNAKSIAKYRPDAEIIAVTHDKRVAGKLSLTWGVTPLLMEYKDNYELSQDMNIWFKENKKLIPKTPIVLVSGVTKGKIGGTNLIQILEIE